MPRIISLIVGVASLVVALLWIKGFPIPPISAIAFACGCSFFAIEKGLKDV